MKLIFIDTCTQLFAKTTNGLIPQMLFHSSFRKVETAYRLLLVENYYRSPSVSKTRQTVISLNLSYNIYNYITIGYIYIYIYIF